MVFQLDARIPLGFTGGYDPAVAQRNQLMRLQREAAEAEIGENNALRDVLRQYGPDLNADDVTRQQAAAAALAGVGPRGYQIAAPIMAGIRNRREVETIMGGGAPAAPAASGAVRAEPLPAAAPAATGAENPQWGDRSLPRGIRNNNPLNLTFVAGQPNVQGSDGRFGRYNSMEDGVAAATRQLGLYAQRGLNTIEGIISRWAPPNENNTQAYINAVARATGFDPRAPLNMQDPQVLSALVAAMGFHENGRVIPMDAVTRGVQLGLGGGMATPASTPASAAPGAPAGAAPAAPAPRMPGQPTPAQFAALAAAAAGGNAAAQRMVQTWAPFMRQENASEPLETVEGPDGRPVLVPRSQAVGRTPIRLPSTVVNNNMPGDPVRSRADAATLTEMQQSAGQARQLISLFDRAERAVRRTPEGQGAQLLPIVGQTARALGIDIEGTSEAEVLRSITLNLATLQRVPGSGATTDMEMRLYLQAVPRLGNTREGNLMLIDMGRRLALRRIQETDIFRRHAGEPDLMERLNALPPVFNPDELRVLEDATPASDPGAAQATGAGGVQANPPAAPAATPRRARNAQGQVIEWNGSAWVPVQ